MKPFTSKHSIAAGSPVHMGGSGKSPLYQDKKTRLTMDGGVLYDQRSGEVVIGGRHNAQGEFVPKTAAQKARDWDQDPRNPEGSERKRRYKEAKEREFNKPENVAKREANKAKRDAGLAARKAREARDKKRG